MSKGISRGYVSLGVEPGTWPSKEIVVSFRGHKITLTPESGTLAASVFVELKEGLSQVQAHELLRAFLSGLAWGKGSRMKATFGTTCSAGPIAIGKGPSGCIVDDGPIEYVPDPADDRAKLALALYREAASVNMIPYEFLGYFKIINVIRERASDQKAWINATVGKLPDRRATKRLEEIQQEQGDVGEYLYVSGRCAVAHAYATPVVNPDDPEETRRIGQDLPLMRALAEYAIEHELGVKSQMAVWTEHLYELEGFRELFRPEVVEELTQGKQVDADRLPIPQHLSLRLQGEEPYPSLENLRASVETAVGGIVVIGLRSGDNVLTAFVVLDFNKERLTFDAMHDLWVKKEETERALRAEIDQLRYLERWIANGVNEVWDPAKNERLGRSDPVLLVNIMPGPLIDGIKGRIAELQSLLNRHDADHSEEEGGAASES